MTVLSLVLGGSADDRERAIAADLPPGLACAAIIEGLPSGAAPLNDIPPEVSLEVIRVAPGCPCCTGNLTMRVTLNRVLRRSPARLYLSLSDATHREQVLIFLQAPQYLDLLAIGPDLQCS
jgi:hypothetical protein